MYINLCKDPSVKCSESLDVLLFVSWAAFMFNLCFSVIPRSTYCNISTFKWKLVNSASEL